MRQACRRKPLLITVILCISAAAMLQGCASVKKDEISLGEWIDEIITKAEITSGSNTAPYFLNVAQTSPYYQSVQTAVEWEILDSSYPFDPDAVLNREWAAYTLVNLGDFDVEKNNIQIRDSSSSRFPRHIQSAVSSGLMSLDKKERFRPMEIMDHKEAEKLLAQVITYLNQKTYENNQVTEIQWEEDLNPVEEEPEEISADTGKAVFPETAELSKGQIVSWKNDAGISQYYQVKEIKEQEGQKEAVLEVPKPEETIHRIYAADTFDVNFNDAEIIDLYDGTLMQQSDVSYTQNESIALMAYHHPLQRTHTIKDWKVTYNITSTTVRAEVYRKSPHGFITYGTFSLNNVKPSYKWKMDGGKLEHGYFRVDFKTNESLGVKNGSYKNLYGDFSRVDPRNFLGTIKNLFQKKNDTVQAEIPLAEIKVPVPGAPMLQIVMRLQLKIFANGKAELSLNQSHGTGMEIRNGSMRVINDHTNQADTVLRADCGILGGVKFGLNLVTMKLADLTVEAGAKAKIASTAHLYDMEGNHEKHSVTEVAADVVNELAEENPDVLVCGDVNAYWVMDLGLNGNGTLARRLGFARTIHVLDETNGKLIPGSKTHLENWQFVDHCTRGEREKKKKTEIVVTDSIQVKSYSMILSPQESKQIQITGLPKGYSTNDLILQLDRDNAAIDGMMVTGKRPGSSIITIETKDHNFKAKVTLLVREKKK